MGEIRIIRRNVMYCNVTRKVDVRPGLCPGEVDVRPGLCLGLGVTGLAGRGFWRGRCLLPPSVTDMVRADTHTHTPPYTLTSGGGVVSYSLLTISAV